jgi:cytoskeletal protein CcmA (bactofilin family)
MVKNLPSVERSTQIRFGKHVPDATEQEENTIVFNASNVLVPTPYSNAVYLSPIRNRTDYTAPEIVLLMYDRNTKEITESGESANALIGGVTLDLAVQRNNATSNTMQFIGGGMLDNGVAFVTDPDSSNKVGIANLLPQHTVSVGSNLYIDDVGSNVLVVSGNVAILDSLVVDGNLRVNGDTSVIYTENTSIKDALIELGTNNGASDTTLDLGILMHRPEALSNVVIGYREGTDEFALAYTDAKPTDKTFTPKLDEDINVHVYGLTHIDANIYAHEDVLVDGNVYVSTNVSITEELTVSNNVYADKDLEVMGNVYVDGNVVAYKDFTLTGNAYVSGNVSITEELTVSNNVYADKDLEVVGNVYVDGNVVAYKDLLVTGNVYVSTNVSVTEELTVSGNVYADKDLEVVGNVYVDGNVVAYKDFTLTGNAYVSGNVSITEELTISNNVYADKDLEVVGNVYVDGNVVAYKDLLVTGNVYVSTNVSVTEELTVTGNVYADKDLEVIGNAYVSGNVNITNQLTVSDNAYVTGNVQVTEALIVSGNTHLEGDNVFITHTMDFLDPTTAIVTDLTSNVDVKLDQLKSVNISSLETGHTLVYNTSTQRWTNDFLESIVVDVKNDNAFTMSKGDAVCVVGRDGIYLNVHLADASDPERMPSIGIIDRDLEPGETGHAVTFGRANNVSIPFIESETVYVSNTNPGHLSNVKPYGLTDSIQNIGIVGLKSSGASTNGVMFVTGIGRSNDIPNAPLITDYNDMNYVYVNNINNDLKKIASENLNIPLTTAVSSSSNSAANAVTLRGVSITSGDGFHGDLVVAGNVTVDSTTLHVDAETNRVGLGTVRPGQLLDVRGAANVGVLTATSGTVTDATHSTSKDTGVIVVTQGGLGVEANIHSTNVFAASHIAVGTSATSNTFDVRGTANVGALVTTSTHISDSTVSTSKTSGALLVTGGAGVTGELHAADTTLDSVKLLNMSTTTLPITDGSKKLVNSFITQDNGTLVINANVEITGNISVVGNTFQVTSNDLVITDRIITLANNNTEHDLDIGIIMEHPNYNIGIIHHGSTHVGGAPGHHLSMGYINEGPDADSVTWKNDAHITANVWGHLITQNTVTVEYGNVYIVDGGLGIGIGDGENDNVPDSKLYVTGNAHVTSNISTDSNVIIGATTESTSTTTGALRVAGGVGIGENLFVGGTGKIENDTDASSTTTGALQVLGGLGVVKSIHAADTTFESVNITDSTNSTDKDTGALIVQSGGAGIELNLNVGGVTKVWDETDATTTTSGALQVLGGLGVAKSIHAADTTFESVTVTDTTHSTTKDTGAIIVQNGGLGVESNIYATNVFAASHIYANVSTAVASANVLDIRGTANVGALVTLSTHISETTTSTSTTTGALQVAGGAGIVENLFVGGTGKIEDDTDASSTTTGALQVVGGLGVAKTIFAADLSSGSVDVTDTTEATDTLTGTLTVAGGISTQTNVHAANVYISGGLITNTAGVTKKTYSFTGALDSGQTIANSTIKITFSAHVFYAKIVAHLIESDNEVSTLSMECGGGHRTGGTPLTIAKGPTSVFGSASTNPWNSAVAATTTTVALAPTTDMAAAGNYNIFIEYISAHPSGAVTKITEGSTDVITFGY